MRGYRPLETRLIVTAGARCFGLAMRWRSLPRPVDASQPPYERLYKPRSGLEAALARARWCSSFREARGALPATSWKIHEG